MTSTATGSRLTGIDIEPAAIEEARQRSVALQVADSLAAPALRAAADDALDACRTVLRRPGAGSDGSAADASAPHSVRGGRPATDQLDPCEVAENTLTRRLAAVDLAALPAALAAELADAEQSVLIARRVHNDAVRDTLDLRSRRLVRWLRLAGTAPVPAYFEIADPQPWQPPAPAPADVVPGAPA